MSSSTSLLAAIGVGFLLGMRHALEPDHLAAVATLVHGDRRRAASLLALGATWGLGHTLAIAGFGGLLLALRFTLPLAAQRLLELGVASMLLWLGARGLVRGYRLARAAGPLHEHGGALHAHGEGHHAHVHIGPFALGLRPLLIGLIHGLAGTGALTALVLATFQDLPSGLAYLGSFGLGSLLGMALVTFAAGAPLLRLRSSRGQSALLSATGLFSLSFGLYWGLTQLR
jgi:high-affinity nickel-transport protein